MFQFIKMVVYVVSIMLAMVGLSCFNYDNILHKGKIREFYIFYIMTSVALGYMFASFILDFVTIHF